MELQELIIRFGLKVDDKALSNLNKIEAGFKGITDVVSGMGKKFTEGQGIWDFFKGSLGEVEEFKKIAAATGMSENSLKRWSDAAKATGANTDEIISDLRNLHTQYGYSEKGVMSLMKSFSKMSREGRKLWIENYGLSDSFALMAEEIDKTSKAYEESHGFTEQQIKDATDAKNNIDKLKNTFNNLSQEVVRKAAPAIGGFADSIKKLMDEHPDATFNTITTALTALTASTIISGLGVVAKSIANIALGMEGANKAAALLAKNPVVLGLMAGGLGLNMIWKGGKNLYHQIKGDGIYEENWLEQSGIMDGMQDMFLEALKATFGDKTAQTIQDVKKEDTSIDVMKINPKEVKIDIPANSLLAQIPQSPLGTRLQSAGNNTMTFNNAVFNVNTLGSPDDYTEGGIFYQTIMGNPEVASNPFGTGQ